MVWWFVYVHGVSLGWFRRTIGHAHVINIWRKSKLRQNMHTRGSIHPNTQNNSCPMCYVLHNTTVNFPSFVWIALKWVGIFLLPLIEMYLIYFSPIEMGLHLFGLHWDHFHVLSMDSNKLQFVFIKSMQHAVFRMTSTFYIRLRLEAFKLQNLVRNFLCVHQDSNYPRRVLLMEDTKIKRVSCIRDQPIVCF